MRRALLIAGFVVITLGIAFLLYYFFFRPVVAPPTPTPTPGVPGQVPVPGPLVPATPTAPGVPGIPPVQPGPPFVGQLPAGIPTTTRTVVLRSQVTRNISTNGTGTRSYNPADGKFYRITADGQAVLMSNQSFPSVERVDWANGSDKAILNFPDGANIYYDFATNRQVTLPSHWEDFDWSPDDTRIAAKSVGNNESNRFLIVANPDGTNAKPVEQLGSNQDKVHVSWSPNNQMIAYSFTGEPLGFDRQSVILVGQNQENFKGLVVEGRGFTPTWSPSGQNLLYSVHNSSDGYRPTLWISGASGDRVNADRRNIQVQTWADKCAFAGETTVICGVPTTMPQGAGLQRDLFRNTPDQIVRIDLQSGTTVNLGQPAGGAAVENMTVTPDGRSAIFTDAVTGRLIRFDL